MTNHNLHLGWLIKQEAKSEKIIAPKNWFSGECAKKSTTDIPFGNFEFL